MSIANSEEHKTILLLQEELAATNQEVMLLTLDLEQRVAERTAELLKTNEELLTQIAERKKVEEEFRKLNEDLIRRTTLLEEANKDLESFSYSVSHDLQAPLRNIAGYIGMLREDSGSMNASAAQTLERVASIAGRMGSLIDELLRFSKASRTELKIDLVDLNRVLDAALGDVREYAEGRKVVWKKAPLPKAIGDAALLRQVFVNLLSNALKYTRTKVDAEIEVGCLDRDEKTSVIFVRDNGVGFDMQYAPKLFGIFQRLHNEREFEGNGIGLANVRRIVMRHGGRTWAEGSAGVGATFYVELPKCETAPG